MLRVYNSSDVPAPYALFMGLKEEHAALLESVEGPQARARYSIVAWGARSKVRINRASRSTLAELKSRIRAARTYDLPVRFKGGLIGYFSFEFVRAIENVSLNESPEGWPDAELFEPEQIAVYDHVNGVVYSTEAISADRPGDVELEVSHAGETMKDEEFINGVKRIKRLIEDGYAFQVVLSKGITYRHKGSVDALYGRLRSINPSPYMFFIKMGERQLIGASPETLFRVENGIAETFPIAGTRPRAQGDEDIRLEREMMSSPKERAEHMMLVDLARNDLGKVCVPGTVMVPELMYVEKYSHVQHIVSRVVGYLRGGYGPVETLEATFPAGTVSGAPKPISIKIIGELEGAGRGPYAGAVGYMSAQSAELSIGIRSAFISGETVRVQAGAGVVYDSTPEGELAEVKNKLKALLVAMGDKQ